MKSIFYLAYGLLLSAAASAYTLVTKITPVQKVLEMMGEMKVNGAKTMEDEARVFRRYTEWAEDEQRELGFQIKTGNSDAEKLTASIEEADQDVADLGKHIEGLEADLNTMETEMKESTSMRKADNSNFMKTQQDLAESVDAIARASETVSSGAQDKAQTSALLQRMTSTNPKMPLVLAAFLEEEELGAPKSAAYESQSGGVLGMLESLGDKFKKELEECEREESNKAHAYELEMQHLTDTVAALKVDLSEKQAGKGGKSAESAKANGDLAKTKAELEEDKKTLIEVTATLKTKTAMFQGNQETRRDELAAISKAIEIVSSPDVSKGLLQTRQVTSLLQTRSSKSRVVSRQRVSRLLEQKAALLSSKALRNLASQVAGAPFTKVIGLVNGLIAKLKEEASAEADHKQWCDDQLKANALTRKTERSSADKLTASVEGLAGEIDTQTKEIGTLSEEQAALSKAMSKATDIRQEENERNVATIKDASAGAEATKQALTVLRKFYASQALLQQAPEMEQYTGQKGSGTGVMGMLEVIESDFLRLKADTSASEAEAVTEYDKFMAEAKVNKSKKHDKEFKMGLDKDKAEHDKSLQTKDLEATEDQLQNANKYYDTLKPTCIEVHVSFEERASRRKEEIKALEEAYGILDNKSD